MSDARIIVHWTAAEVATLKRIYSDPGITNRAAAIREWLPERGYANSYSKAVALGLTDARVPQERLDRRVAATRAIDREAEEARQRDQRLVRKSRSRVSDRVPAFLKDVFAYWGVE